MKTKRKIAVFLATVITTAMLPINAFADSSNSQSKMVTVKNGDPIGSVWVDDSKTEVATSGDGYKPVCLKIRPRTGIEKDSSIIINIENGRFDEDFYPMPTYLSGARNTYARMMETLESGLSLKQVLSDNLGTTGTVELPYNIVNVSEKELEIQLFPVDADWCDKSTNPIASEKVYYYIPIHAIADGTGDVKITVDANESNVSGGGTYTIAHIAKDSSIFTDGDANNNGTLTADDAAQVLYKVLNNSYETELEKNYYNWFTAIDVDCDGILTSADSAMILQKTLDNSFKMNCEK